MGSKLEGRTAIVTGAGRGIGASVARLFAREGADVVVADLGVSVDGSGPDNSPAAQVVEDIKKNGGEAVANNGDVADWDAAEGLIRQAIDSYGRLDVLVNVAGILRDRMVFNMTEEEWDAVVRVHLKGTFNTVRHASSAYLASTRSDWCTGQVIQARGYTIGLYNIPAIIREIESPGPWDLDTAFNMIERSFTPAVTGKSRMLG
jgi:NAD(P)-dependent dehydrogenase (short-subunit alcohol dehydrogenase family)